MRMRQCVREQAVLADREIQSYQLTLCKEAC